MVSARGWRAPTVHARDRSIAQLFRYRGRPAAAGMGARHAVAQRAPGRVTTPFPTPPGFECDAGRSPITVRTAYESIEQAPAQPCPLYRSRDSITTLLRSWYNTKPFERQGLFYLFFDTPAHGAHSSARSGVVGSIGARGSQIWSDICRNKLPVISLAQRAISPPDEMKSARR